MSNLSFEDASFSLEAEEFGVIRQLTLELSNGDVAELTSRGWTPEVNAALRAIVKSVPRQLTEDSRITVVIRDGGLDAFRPPSTISVPRHLCALWPVLLTTIWEYLGSAEARFRTGYHADEILAAIAALTVSVTEALQYHDDG